MRFDRIGFLLAAATLFGCASTDRRELYTQLEPEVMRPYEELNEQKAELWHLGFEPQEFEFDGQGKVTVREWALTGWPGNVYVSARVTYENTTEQAVEHAIVWLEVLDSNDQVLGSSAVRLMNPMGYPMWPGHTYTLDVRTPTNDAHLDPAGWQWGVACEALPDPDPGAKPVLVVTQERAARGEAPGFEPGWQRVNGQRGTYQGTYYRRDCPTVTGLHTPGVTRYTRF